MANAGVALAGGAALAVLLFTGVGVQAQAPESSVPEAEAEAGRLPGYLDSSPALDISVFLPPPPDDNSRRGIVDHVTFLATRSLQGTQRWDLAAKDASTDPGGMLDAFSCAVGGRLEIDNLPQTARLLARATVDVGAPVGAAKDRYDRTRPFIAMSGRLCADTSYLSGSGSYPSGHTAVGWLYALVLTQLAPDRASQILARGRVYGESRVVCGAHYPTDVEGGRLTATAVFGLLQAQPEYLADVEGARTELQSARADAPAPDMVRCAVERDAAANATW